MLIKPTLFLRNEEGASPGGGAPTPAATPAPATGAPAPAAVVPVEQLKEVVGGMLSQWQDGFFAKARKAGLLGQDKPADSPTPAPAPAPAPTANAPSHADLERTIEIRFAVNQMRADHGLSEAAANHLKAYLSASKPDDVGAAAKSFLSDLGLVKAPAPVTPNIATESPAQPSKPPITPAQLGAPAPSDTRDPEAILHSRPQDATAQDFERLVAKHGHAKALDMWATAQMAHAKTIRVVPDYRRTR